MNALCWGTQLSVPCETELQDVRLSEWPSGSESLAIIPGPDTDSEPCRVYESLTATGGELGIGAAQPELLRRYIVAPSTNTVVMRSNIAGRLRPISRVRVNTNGSACNLSLMENDTKLSCVIA